MKRAEMNEEDDIFRVTQKEEAEQPEPEEEKRYPPSVEDRWNRQLSVTFTTDKLIEQVRQLALEWGLYAADGRSPATSTVVEWLLLPMLEAAEAGEIGPPPRGWRQERRLNFSESDVETDNGVRGE